MVCPLRVRRRGGAHFDACGGPRLDYDRELIESFDTSHIVAGLSGPSVVAQMARAFEMPNLGAQLARSFDTSHIVTGLDIATTYGEGAAVASAEIHWEQLEDPDPWLALRMLLILQRPDLSDDPAAQQLVGALAFIVAMVGGATLLVVAPELFAYVAGLAATYQAAQWVRSKSSGLVVPKSAVEE